MAISRLFVASEIDILRCRVKTIGMNEIFFNYRDMKFTVVDVGGQRSERRKWVHARNAQKLPGKWKNFKLRRESIYFEFKCFANVHAIIFVVAIGTYDTCLDENRTVNKMSEALKLFSSVCNNVWFRHTESCGLEIVWNNVNTSKFPDVGSSVHR